LSGDRTEALEAQKLFGMILATGEAFPAPADISVDLRSNEIYAESILGMAFAKSITDSPATVRTWLDLLEAADTAEYVGESLPYWRIALLVRSEAYGEVLTLLQRLPEDAPVSWLRLAAVSGLGARSGTAAARALGTEAIAMLAARGELAQVVDLAEQFNLTDMERDGFALHYVSGVCRYEDARAANDAGDRSTALRIYRVALDDLDAALSEPDAESFPDAVPGAIAMRAWCLHELGRFEEASVLFQDAAERHVGMDAGNYLWMALVSLDSVEATTVGGEPIDELRARLITRFLNDHPAHPNAPNALLRRFAGIANPTLEDAEMLVMVPTSTSNGAKAHQQGVQMLYRIFRRGAGAERGEAARRFLELVPVPRFSPDTPTLDLQLQLLRVRQLLDISLNTEVARTDVARATLDALDRGVDVGLVDVGGKERELDYRRLCLALLEGHPEDALYYFGLLEDDVDDWTGVAARTLYNAAVVVLADEESSVEDSRVQYGVEAVRRTAGFLLGGDPADVDFTDQSKYRIGRSLALAEQRAHASSGDPEVLARAYGLLVALNTTRPRDERVLEGLALAAEASGEDDAALAARRTLVSGSAVGSDPWFRRKHDLVILLARVDPQRARDVLDQHAVLHPDYGPEPWGPRLSALHLKLQAGGGGS
jgi:tetratricopeptide (TPR) repeat protein